jgi:hypothetical protein
MESEGGFCALILVHAVLMQRVATTPRACIVEWLTEIVSIQKPVKATARSPVPARIPSQRIRLHAGGNHGVGFHWLLIETGALLPADPETIAANRREMTTVRLLRFTSQRSDRSPMSMTSPREVQYPLRIIAWESFALS